VDETQMTLKNVSFYNVGGTTAETARELIPMDARCFYDHAKAQFTVEYVKNTSAGTVNAVCVGRDFASVALYLAAIKDPSALPDLANGVANYILEFTADSTTIYRTNNAAAGQPGAQIGFNFKTKAWDTFAVAAMHTNINAQFGAVAIGGALYKSAKKSAADGAYTATLSTVANWKSAATAATKDIVFTARSGATLDTTALPVLVARPDLNAIEVFASVSEGAHGADGYGFNIQKAVVNLANLTYSVEDLGIFKYEIGNSTTATIGQYKTGCFYDGKYTLPYWRAAAANSIVADGTATFQSGVIVDGDFESAEGFVNFQTAAAIGSVPVITDAGVKMIRASAVSQPYIYASQILSGANLNEPVVKTEYDLLRVIYRYTLV
jgi:hypothetical protein